MVTVIDVAQAAKVSRTTVSNVLNGNGGYSEETRQAVLDAARRLGYKPNLAARSLATRSSRLIGLILPSYVSSETLTNSPFYNIIIDSIYSVLRLEAYYDLIIFSVPSREQLLQVSDWIDARNVDGILAVGEFDEAFMKQLDAKDVPVMLIDNTARGHYANFSHINSDDEHGGYLAAKHLAERGFKKIAACVIDPNSPVMRARYQGYRQALVEAKLQEHRLDGTGAPFESGLRFAEQLTAQGFDGAFCTEDMSAVGLVHALSRMGIEVGAAFGVVGFDNISTGKHIFPTLTTIDQNIQEKGRIAVQALLSVVKGEAQRGSRVTLPVSLVVRESA